MTDEMIIEAIRSVKMNDIDSGRQGVAGVAPVANPEAVSRFQAAMGVEQVEQTQAVEAIPFADKVSAAWRASQENYQGLLHRIKALTEFKGEHSLSAAELSELQYEIATLSFQQEVVAKVADKASNAVQTLIKNQ